MIATQDSRLCDVNYILDNRSRRLVLEAWDRLEGMEIGKADGDRGQEAENKPTRDVIMIAPEMKPSNPAATPTELSRPVVKAQMEEEKPVQPSFTDFGLYKCQVCGKMVMGIEKEDHQMEVHKGKAPKYKKLR